MTDFSLFHLDNATFNELFTDNKDVLFFKDIGKRNWILIEKKLTTVDAQSFNGIKGTIHLKESPVEPGEFPNRNENLDDPLKLERSTQINFNNRFVQVLDGASNSTCDIYEVSDTDFKEIFGNKLILRGKEIPIIEDQFWTESFYIKPVDKKLIQKLDGILVP